MPLQKFLCELNDFRLVSTRCLFHPDAEIIGALSSCGGGRRLECMSQIFARFIKTRWRGVKGQLGQANPSLRHARISREITNELLQRCRRFFVAALLLQFSVVNLETRVIAEL